MQVGRLSRLLWMLFLALSSTASLSGQSSQQNLPDAPHHKKPLLPQSLRPLRTRVLTIPRQLRQLSHE